MIGLSRVVLLTLLVAVEPSRIIASTATDRAPAAPTALVVTTATKGAVAISWTSPAGTKIVVERKALGSAWPIATPAAAAAAAATPTPTPSTIAIVTATTANDSKIDQYATYVYRVRSQGADNALSVPSNEVIAGPPPVGITSIIATPKAMQAHDPQNFANQMRMAFDANDDPTIVYMTNDLNNDGELDDTDLSVITWNRARYKWNAPVAIDTIGNVLRSGTRMPFSFTRDQSTGQFALLHTIGEHELRLSTSDDNGLTWKHILVQKSGADEAGFSTPSIAMAGGRVYLAYAVGNDAVVYRTGLVTDAPGKWTSAKAPVPSGQELKTQGINARLDAAGKPVVTYMLAGDSYNTNVMLWRPDVNKTVKIMDTRNIPNDDPGLDLQIQGAQMAVAFYGALDDKFFANHQIWFAHSTDNGATWSAAVVAANDGGNGMGPPVTVSLDRAGHAAMFATVDGGNDGEVKCGMPKLMRSTDGVKWTTCAPDTKGAPSTSDAVFPIGAFAGNDKLYIAFKVRQGAPSLAPGLALWRER
ncbi:MAG: sialidase family protein [Gemmatimonadaceae bacterium]